MLRLTLILALLCSLASLGVAHANAPDIPPVSVTGTVTVDGQPARVNAQIAAAHDGTFCAGANYDGSHYSLTLTSAAPACWTPGNLISFTVDGRSAHETLSSPSSTGITLTLNLSVGQAPQSSVSPSAYAITRATTPPATTATTPPGATAAQPADEPAAALPTTTDAASAPTDAQDTSDAATSADGSSLATPLAADAQRPSGPSAQAGPPSGTTVHLLAGSGAGTADVGTFVTGSGMVTVCFIIDGISQTGLSGPQFQVLIAPAGGPTEYQSPSYSASNCAMTTLREGPGQYYLSVVANGWTNWTLAVD